MSDEKVELNFKIYFVELDLKQYKHNPPHLFLPDAKYFITASIYLRRKLLKSEDSKEKLLFYIRKSVDHFDWKLEEWVILDNHYHLMLESPGSPEDLPDLMANIHKYSAIWINKHVNNDSQDSKVWHNYWDKCLTFEKSYYTRLNYIWYNPVKHRYVENAEEWNFGSFGDRFRADQEYIMDMKKKYPFDKLKIDDDF
ncbi:MAG: transposase [Ignavibacteria bacterium]|nr:transposase [Ignavibacteria bacterium]